MKKMIVWRASVKKNSEKIKCCYCGETLLENKKKTPSLYISPDTSQKGAGSCYCNACHNLVAFIMNEAALEDLTMEMEVENNV